MSKSQKSSSAKLHFKPLDYAAAVGIVTYAASATVTPICLVILARELSFSLHGGGFLEVVRSVLLLVILLTSGFAAARWGKAVSLGVSSLVLGGGMLLYSIAPSYGAIVLGVGLLGLGGGVLEGLLNPLVQDLHPTDSGRYLNIVNGFWSIGVLFTMIVAGELLSRSISWRAIAVALGALSVISGILFLLLRHSAPQQERVAPAEVLAHKKRMLKMPRFWLFMGMMFAAGAAEGAFMFWSASFIQLHFDTLPRAGGIGAAMFAGGMIAGRFGSGFWVRQDRLWHLLVFSGVGGLGISVLVPLLSSLPTVFVGLFLAGLTVACFWPSLQSYAADRLPVETTALFILLSCGGIPGFAFASWAIGWIGGQTSLRSAFFVVPSFFLLLVVLLVVERRWKIRI